MSRLGLGVVGCGAFSRFALEALASIEELRLVAVADHHAENRRAAVDRWLAGRPRPEPGEASPAEYEGEELVAHPDVDVIYVATQPNCQVGVAVRAVEAGKGIFVEKPGALRAGDLEEISRNARARGLPAGVDLCLAEHPAYRLVADAVEESLLGELRAVRVFNAAGAPKPDHWFWVPERSGGVWIEHGVHFLDLDLGWAGPAEEVAALAGPPGCGVAEVRHRGRVGSAVESLHYQGFTLAHRRELTWVRCVFARGDVLVEDWIPGRIRIWPGASGSLLERAEHATAAPRGEAYLACIAEAFRASILGSGRSIERAVAALRLAERIHGAQGSPKAG